MTYPKEAILDSIQGKVVVSFVVCEDSLVTDIKVRQTPHDILSKEAVRIVSLFPPFTPGKSNGEKVREQINLPIKFELE